jgi:hypothetical protein
VLYSESDKLDGCKILICINLIFSKQVGLLMTLPPPHPILRTSVQDSPWSQTQRYTIPTDSPRLHKAKRGNLIWPSCSPRRHFFLRGIAPADDNAEDDIDARSALPVRDMCGPRISSLNDGLSSQVRTCISPFLLISHLILRHSPRLEYNMRSTKSHRPGDVVSASTLTHRNSSFLQGGIARRPCPFRGCLRLVWAPAHAPSQYAWIYTTI